METNIIIIPKRGFSEEDLLYFIDNLEGKTYVATYNRVISVGKFGSKVIPDFSVEEVFYMHSVLFDRIIFIADEGYKYFLKYTEIPSLFARYKYSRRTIILSSLSQYAFAKMGLLNGYIITYNYEEFPEYLEKFREFGIKFANYPYVFMNNVITVKGRENILELLTDLKRIEEEIRTEVF